MASVIGMPSKDRRGAIELFREHKPRQSMGQRERSKREKQRGPQTRRIRPAARRTDGEDRVLHSSLAVGAKSCGEGLRVHLFPAAIEKNELGRGAAALALEPGEQGVLALERLIAASQSIGAAFQVGQCRRLQGFVRREAGSDVGHSDVHEEENILAAPGRIMGHRHLRDKIPQKQEA